MSIHNNSADDLAQYANAGGGFRLNSSRFSIDELILIAKAANSGDATVVLTNIAELKSDDVMQINAIGNGRIILEH